MPNDAPPAKATKAALIDFLRNRLRNSDRWATQGLVRIFENQTEDERQSHETRDSNGIGFTGVDAEFLSTCAEAFKRHGYLSPARMVHIRRKMPKYAAQLFAASNREILERSWRKSLTQPTQALLPL